MSSRQARWIKPSGVSVLDRRQAARLLTLLLPVMAVVAGAGSGSRARSADVAVEKSAATRLARPDYLDYSGRSDALSGGARQIEIKTAKGAIVSSSDRTSLGRAPFKLVVKKMVPASDTVTMASPAADRAWVRARR